MEFDFSINALFHEPISLITAESLLRNDRQSRQLEDVINTIGAKSALAQNLSSPITTWSKLRINGHRVYVLSSPSANNGRGHVLGFIKVGQKQLFVLDRDGKHNEMHPLCVLDFYVHESHQRKGHGLRLFQHMLDAENIEPAHLAIDRPSSKFSSFLRRHFTLWASIPQVNNFVVFDGFFKKRKDGKKNARHRGQYDGKDDFSYTRAFSEDVIQRNRRKYYNPDSLNGIRPMSTSVTNGSGDLTSRYQCSVQDSRPNIFSRFAVDKNGYIPSPIQNRRSLRSRHEEEIITNPYRRVTNTRSRNRELDDEVFGLHGTEKSGKSSEEYQQLNSKDQIMSNGSTDNLERKADDQPEKKQPLAPDQFIEVKNDYNAPKRRPRVSSSEVSGSTGEGLTGTDRNCTRTPVGVFQANSGYSSIRNKQYSRPSDMIAELKQKDMEASRQTSSGNRRSVLGTSWNVFGIPSPVRQRWPK